MSLAVVLSNRPLTASEAVFEWIMDASQLPPESICALCDVARSGCTHSSVLRRRLRKLGGLPWDKRSVLDHHHLKRDPRPSSSKQEEQTHTLILEQRDASSRRPSSCTHPACVLRSPWKQQHAQVVHVCSKRVEVDQTSGQMLI